MDDPGPVKELIANVNGLMVSGGVDHRGHIESRLLIRTLAALKLQGTIMDPKKKVDDINGQKKKKSYSKAVEPNAHTILGESQPKCEWNIRLSRRSYL